TDIAIFSGYGPLAGIYSVMEKVEATHYIVLPCDMPLINQHIIETLLSCHETDVTIVDVNGQIQPLVSVWDAKMKDKIYDFLQRGHRKLEDLFSEVNCRSVSAQLLTESSQV